MLSAIRFAPIAAIVLTTLSTVAVSPVLAQQATTATGEAKTLSGTVTIDSTQIAFILSGNMGGGTLSVGGKQYPFDIGGLGVGGIGVQKMSAHGKVYNLGGDVSKFAGNYVQARAGATLGSGKSALSLSNQHGVIMELQSANEGVALSVGVDGIVVSMKN